MIPETVYSAVEALYSFLDPTIGYKGWRSIAYSPDTVQYGYVRFQLPEAWIGDMFRVRIIWTSFGAPGDVVWAFSAIAWADGDDLDAGLSDEVFITQSIPDIGPTSDALVLNPGYVEVTPTGSPVGGAVIHLRIRRAIEDEADTLGKGGPSVGSYAMLSGLTIQYEITQKGSTDWSL